MLTVITMRWSLRLCLWPPPRADGPRPSAARTGVDPRMPCETQSDCEVGRRGKLRGWATACHALQRARPPKPRNATRGWVITGCYARWGPPVTWAATGYCMRHGRPGRWTVPGAARMGSRGLGGGPARDVAQMGSRVIDRRVPPRDAARMGRRVPRAAAGSATTDAGRRARIGQTATSCHAQRLDQPPQLQDAARIRPSHLRLWSTRDDSQQWVKAGIILSTREGGIVLLLHTVSFPLI